MIIALQKSGLYAAGDAASREFLAGLASGGGGPNAAWAISTGNGQELEQRTLLRVWALMQMNGLRVLLVKWDCDQAMLGGTPSPLAGRSPSSPSPHF